jgi:hypothetical protein
MKPIRVILLALVLAGQSLAANLNVYTGATGRTDLAIKVQTAANTWISQALTEGTGANGSRVGQYFATEAQLVTAGVNTASTGNGFVCVVEDASGPVTGSFYLPWDGDSETSAPVELTQDQIDDIVAAVSGFTESQRAQILAALSIGEETGVPKAQTWVIKRIDGQMKATAFVPKDVDEEIDVFADFRSVLAEGDAIDPDDGIVSIEVVDDGGMNEVESDAFDDVADADLWMNAGVRFRISGGTAGQTDRIRVTVLTVGGQTLSVPCPVKVTDAGAP